MNKNNEKIDLPYNTDINLLDDMLTDLKNTGKEGVSLDTLWINIKASKNPNRSYTMGLAKFLGIVDSDGKKIWLTDLGVKLRFGTKEDRNKLLAKSLPDKYQSMFKWILNSGQMRNNELKTQFIDAWGSPNSLIMLDKYIATFLNYCKWINLVTYSGRGNQTNAAITPFGRSVFESGIASEHENISEVETSREIESSINPSNPLQIIQNATYPILIKTNDREFPWDIKSETDWNVIDSVIASIKEGWKQLQKQQLSDKGDDK